VIRPSPVPSDSVGAVILAALLAVSLVSAGAGTIVAQDEPAEGSLRTDATPGEAGVENNVSFAFDASEINDEQSVRDIWIDLDDAIGVNATAISADDVSIEGEDTGTPGVDAATEDLPGVLRVTVADSFTLDNESGVLTITVTGVEVPNSGTFSAKVGFLDDGSAVVAFGNDQYTIDEKSQDPAEFDVAITGTNSPVTAGETLQIDARIENTGDVSDTQTVDLSVDGLGSDGATVSLAGSESTTETFTVDTADDDADSYTATVASDDDSASTPVEVESESGTVEGPLTVDVGPGEASVGNDYTFAFDASEIGDERSVRDIWIDFDDASGVDAAAISADDVSVEGDGTGTPGVDATAEDLPGVLRVTVADSFTLDSEDGVVTINVTGVEVPEDGTFDTELAFLDGEGDVIAVGTDQYTIDEKSQDPPEFDVAITDTNSPATESGVLQVDARIENVGDIPATQTVKLLVDGLGSDGATVALAGGESTTVTLTLYVSEGDAGSYTATVYSDDTAASAPIEVEPGFEERPPPVVGESSPRDPDGDGLYEDIDGDGEFSIGDVQHFLQNRDTGAVRTHPECFEFGGDDPPTRGHVRALFVDFVDDE